MPGTVILDQRRPVQVLQYAVRKTARMATPLDHSGSTEAVTSWSRRVSCRHSGP
jgi:hypothetical protein